jgi:hypothetical protein
MYVIVGIASYNEADSIAGVVRAADQGLRLLAREFPGLRALILNADSDSADGTAGAFLGTPTSCDKKAITTSGEPGKGKNILAMIALAQAQRADCLLMLDGDIESAEPEWIVGLVRPVLLDTADFVTPEYDRTLFDGAITCHFAWPLLLSVFGRDIQQPIAGDFALGRRLLSYVHEDATPSPVFLYGIDIYLTLTAVTQDLRIATARLGGKRHKPSHPKLLTMFPQVANSAAPFVALSAPGERARPGERTRLGDAVEKISFLRRAPYTQRDDATQLLSAMLPRAAELSRTVGWLSELEAEASAALVEGEGLPAGIWSKILAAWIRHLCSQSRGAADCGEELMPFFMIRAVTFWRMVATSGEDSAVRDLKQVPLLLHEQLRRSDRP